MAGRILKIIDAIDKKYSRQVMLLFAIIWGILAIFKTLNPGPNFYDQFWVLHMIGLYMLYALALGYIGIFIFWKRFHKPQKNTVEK